MCDCNAYVSMFVETQNTAELDCPRLKFQKLLERTNRKATFVVVASFNVMIFSFGTSNSAYDSKNEMVGIWHYPNNLSFDVRILS